MVQCFPWFTRMSAGTWEPFSWGSLGFPPRGPGSRAGFGSHPGQGVSSSPLLPAPRQGRPRGSGALGGRERLPPPRAHLGQQDAPSSVSPDTSPAGISDPIAAGDDGTAPGRSARAPEGLTRAGRSRPARDRAAPSAAAAPAEGGEGSAARRGWQQDGAGGEGAEELRVAEWVTVGAPSWAPRPGPSAADVPAPPSPVCGVGGARRGGVRGPPAGAALRVGAEGDERGWGRVRRLRGQPVSGGGSVGSCGGCGWWFVRLLQVVTRLAAGRWLPRLAASAVRALQRDALHFFLDKGELCRLWRALEEPKLKSALQTLPCYLRAATFRERSGPRRGSLLFHGAAPPLRVRLHCFR